MILARILLCFFLCFFTYGQSLAQTLTTYRFAIPQLPADEALIEFALQMQLNVVFLDDLTNDIQANKVDGELTVDNALKMLLADTGLHGVISNNRVIQIQRRTQRPKPQTRPAQTLPNEQNRPIQLPLKDDIVIDDVIDEIVVVGRFLSPYNLGASISSTKTRSSFLDTPQVINTISQKLFQDIGARDYDDAILLSSSVSYLERSAGVVDETRLRGFAYPALKTDGFGSHAYITPIDLALVENIEITKGPNSVLFGRMEPGGIVNLILKHPSDTANLVRFRYASDELRRTELDVNLKSTDDLGVRAVAYWQEQGNAESLNLDDRLGGLLSMSYVLGNNSELTAYYRYAEQTVLRQFGRPVEGFDDNVEIIIDDDGSVDVLSPVLEDLRSGLDVQQHSVYVGIQDWMLGDWSANAHFQFDRYTVDTSLRYPFIDELTFDFNGETISSNELTDSQLDDPDLLRSLLEGIDNLNIESISFIDAPLQYDTSFFSAESTLYNTSWVKKVEIEQLYGVNYSQSSPESLIWQTHDTRSTFVPTGQLEAFFNAGAADNNVTDTNLGVFAQWSATWDSTTILVGTRVDHIVFESTALKATKQKRFTETSYRLGLLQELNETSSIFFNYSEAFSPQFALQDGPLFTNEEGELEASQIIEFISPAPSKQFELGGKALWFGNKLQTNCSIYHIEKDKIESDTKEQRSSGVECDVIGSINNQWHLTLGFSYIDAKIIRSEEQNIEGNTPRMTPEKSLRFWLTKDISVGNDWFYRFGIGVNYVGQRFLTEENEQTLPSYSTISGAITMEYKNRVFLSVMLQNAFDEQYTQGVFASLPLWSTAGQSKTLETQFSYRF